MTLIFNNVLAIVNLHVRAQILSSYVQRFMSYRANKKKLCLRQSTAREYHVGLPRYEYGRVAVLENNEFYNCNWCSSGLIPWASIISSLYK